MPTSPEGEGSAGPTRDSPVQAWQSIATILTPLTTVAAVLGYVGWVRNRAIFEYFGVSLTLVSFTPQDYLFRSAPVGFGGVLLLGLAATALLVLDRFAMWILKQFEGNQRRIRTAIALCGLVLVVLALGMATPTVMRAGVPSVVGAGWLALGAALFLRFGVTGHARSRLSSPAATGLCVVLLLFAGFWALTAYAKDLGDGAARDLNNNLDALPVVTVYSREPIDLAGSSVQASRILDQDEKWSYRYTGAKLLLYSNDRWFLIPEPSSTVYRSSVTVLRDTEAVRVEMAAPQQ
jgi:hypothetical protein